MRVVGECPQLVSTTEEALNGNIQQVHKMVSNNDDNTDVMELAESLLLLSKQVPTTDTLPIDAPKQQDVIREINESHGVETEPTPSHPIPNPVEFNVPNIEPQGDLENTDDIDKTIIYDPPEEEDTTDHQNEKGVTKGTFITRVVGIPCIPWSPKSKQTKFCCINCGISKPPRGAVDKHYHESYPPVFCVDCNQIFTTPDTLLRH